ARDEGRAGVEARRPIAAFVGGGDDPEVAPHAVRHVRRVFEAQDPVLELPVFLRELRGEVVQPGARVGVEHEEGRLLPAQVFQQHHQHDVLVDVDETAGVEAVAVAQHGGAILRPRGRSCRAGTLPAPGEWPPPEPGSAILIARGAAAPAFPASGGPCSRTTTTQRSRFSSIAQTAATRLPSSLSRGCTRGATGWRATWGSPPSGTWKRRTAVPWRRRPASAESSCAAWASSRTSTRRSTGCAARPARKTPRRWRTSAG